MNTSDDQFELLVTKDGSHTLRSSNYGVTYHSIHGAITESDHVFIQAGLNSLNADLEEIQIFEMGFGTGLNPLLTSLYAQYHKGHFHYCGVEQNMLPASIIAQLNYPQLLQLESNQKLIFQDIHVHDKGHFSFEESKFSFVKHQIDFCDFNLGEDQFDLIYFDAFAPTCQEELWRPNILADCYKACRKNAIMVTYCAKGQLRRDLQSVGFTVERLPGPPGKREMLRARKL